MTRTGEGSIPESAKMARMIRTGRTVNDLAVRYGINSHVIVRRLADSGWDPGNGQWIGGDKVKGSPLAVQGQGVGKAMHYVGGGDNPTGIPTTSRPFRERPKPTGFAWPAPTDAPFPVVPAVIRAAEAERERRRSLPPDYSRLRAANEARRKLSTDDLAEIARAYIEDYESSVRLAERFNVNQRTIRKALRSMGVHIRTRSEAGYVRWRPAAETTQDGAA